MPFAVELFFDEAADQAVRAICHTLANAGISTTMQANGSCPHVSLGVCEEVDATRFRSALMNVAHKTPALEFSLASVGLFPTAEGVVFLAPVVTRDLLKIHEAYHAVFAEYAGSRWAYYLPGNWVPHCTLAINLPRDRIAAAVDLCRDAALPIQGRFEWVGLTQFPPVTRLYGFELRQ
jgi:2'-5' RNA ligase